MATQVSTAPMVILSACGLLVAWGIQVVSKIEEGVIPVSASRATAVACFLRYGASRTQ